MSFGTDLEDAYSGDKRYNSSFLQDNDDLVQSTQQDNSPFVETINAFPLQHHDARPQQAHVTPPSSQHAPVQNLMHPVSEHTVEAVNPVQGQAPNTAFQYNYDSVRQQMQNEAAQHKLDEAQSLAEIQQVNPRVKRRKNEHFTDKGSHEKKRGDVYKSLLFTLMILLAISTHYFIYFVYEQFVTASGQYSLKQEAGFRLIYPLIILAFIWYAKS